jgi:hypothetical protein
MTSKAYVLTETALKFNGEAGADVAWSMEGVTDGAGRVSAQYDLGAGARAFEFDWSCELLWQATPVQYQALELYIAGAPDGDSTQISGDIGATDAALGDIDQVSNLQLIGTVVVEDAGVTKMVASGSFEFSNRYITIAGLNNGGATINATDSNFIFTLTPKSIQGQAT